MSEPIEIEVTDVLGFVAIRRLDGSVIVEMSRVLRGWCDESLSPGWHVRGVGLKDWTKSPRLYLVCENHADLFLFKIEWMSP